MSLSFSSLSRVKDFFLFLSRKGERGRVFAVFSVLFPSREGNFGLHSTPSNYSSFYGI